MELMPLILTAFTYNQTVVNYVSQFQWQAINISHKHQNYGQNIESVAYPGR